MSEPVWGDARGEGADAHGRPTHSVREATDEHRIAIVQLVHLATKRVLYKKEVRSDRTNRIGDPIHYRINKSLLQQVAVEIDRFTQSKSLSDAVKESSEIATEEFAP